MKLSATESIFWPSIHELCMRSSVVSGRKTAVAITVWSVFSSLRERTLSRGVFKFVNKAAGLEGFGMDFVEGRNAIVPFEKRGGSADKADGVGIHLPNRVENRMIVGIKNVFFELRMAGNVDLPDAMVRNVV